MGSIFGKHRTVSTSQPEPDSVLNSTSISSKEDLQRSQVLFCSQFKNEFSRENIHELQVFFSMVNVTAQDVSNTLFKNMQGFRKIFQNELQKYCSSLQVTDQTEEMVSDCLKNHCIGVLLTHIEIIEHINDPVEIDKILDQTASSHCFVNNIQSNFKMHNDLLERCLKNEFCRSTNKTTIKSLNKYMKLINSRLQFLTEHFSIKSDSSSILEAMAKQKKIAERGTDNLLKQIYLNPNSPTVSGSLPTISSETSLQPQASTKADSSKRLVRH